MSGIPVYTYSPINAAKASGVTPKTQEASSHTTPAPSVATAASSTTSYPPAQPGYAAFPAPTGAPQRYAPNQPTPTTKWYDGPPPPQPGAFPTPSKSSVAPPPKAGEKYNPPQPQATPQPYPPQLGIPPPTSAVRPPYSSTSATTTPSYSHPAVLPSNENNGPRRSIEHPSGYHQNAYASELTHDQRMAQAANESSSTGINASGIGGLDTESAWNTAKQWVGSAGNKLSNAEKEVWKYVGKE